MGDSPCQLGARDTRGCDSSSVVAPSRRPRGRRHCWSEVLACPMTASLSTSLMLAHFCMSTLTASWKSVSGGSTPVPGGCKHGAPRHLGRRLEGSCRGHGRPPSRRQTSGPWACATGRRALDREDEVVLDAVELHALLPVLGARALAAHRARARPRHPRGGDAARVLGVEALERADLRDELRVGARLRRGYCHLGQQAVRGGGDGRPLGVRLAHALFAPRL